MIAPFPYKPDVHEAGRACAPEPNGHIIWDGVIAVKRRRRPDVVQRSVHPSKIGRDVSLIADRPNLFIDSFCVSPVSLECAA